MTDSDSESADPVVVTKKKESFWKRNLFRLSSSSNNSTNNRNSLHQLIPQAEIGELNGELTEEHQADLINQQKNKIRRPRSAGDISETLHQCTAALASVAGGVSTFPGGSTNQVPEGSSVVSSTAFSRGAPNSDPNSSNRQASPSSPDTNNYNHNNNNETLPTSNGGGGILSFFGVRFKSSATRHLEKNGCNSQPSLDCNSHLVVSSKSCTGVSSAVTGTASSNNNNNNNKLNGGDLRYTKFPLAYGKGSGGATTGNVTGGQIGNNASSSPSTHHPPNSRSYPLSSINGHKSQLCRSLDSSQQSSESGADGCSSSNSSADPAGLISTIPSDSLFEESQIHFTPQTRTYAHPHRSPLPAHHAPTASSSSGNFLTNTVTSIGRKVVNSVTPGSKSKHNKSKLKVKSKSDNNLHRVNSNANVNSVIASGCQSSSSGGSIPVPRNALPFITPHGESLLRHQSFESTSSDSERRLNSVQLGDHATIRLPWTGFQQINNLSSVSTTRTFIPNTHNNNFEFSSLSSTFSSIPQTSSGSANTTERYVECGSNILRTVGLPAALPVGHQFQSNSGPRLVANNSRSGSSREVIVTRRRSRSLEKCSNFRVFPVHANNTSCATSDFVDVPHNSGGTLLGRSHSRKETGSEREKQRIRSAHSLERNTSHKVRQLLTPTEQEILLRNIDWNPSSCVQQPPRRPDKPLKSSSGSFVSASRSCRTEQQQYGRPFEKLHRSAPSSSFSNSSESGESSYSAPPSPPPRPASTLKPESKLIIHHPSSLSSTSVLLRQQHHHHHHHHSHQQNRHIGGGFSFSGTTTTNSAGIIMNSVPKRRPVAPSSHGSSSDSGVSHVSSSTSTVRGTSDFSDESAGSVNIGQQSTSVLSQHSTTSSSGVSHHSHSASVSSNNNATPISSSAAPAGISLEDVRNSGFINKPPKGWLHSDNCLSKEGVTYTVRYIGCLDVNTSMKSLDFDTRSLIAKECINQVCEAAGLRSQDKKRKMDRRVARILGVRPRLEHAGSDVRLTITSTCLKLTSLDTGAVIAVHDMPNISFASGGDATMLDFVAYVAKDSIVGRACFVLECGSGLAQDVICSVGQAFELRFKEYLQKRPPPPRIPVDDPEYYNDLPGKVPPESLGASKTECKDKIRNVSRNATSTRAKEPPPLNLHSTSDKELSVNLIDFEAPTPPAFGPSVEDKQLDSFLLPGSDHSSGANNLGASGGNSNNLSIGGSTGLGLPNSPSQPQPKDPFDMQPFASALPQSIPADVIKINDQRRLLEGEIWFHGTVSRGESEDLLKQDGDFLVRESLACTGQFVLTGLQGGSPKHLLLVDPEGIVRTKDRTFDNVIHLVKYHSENCLPIISAESMVILRTPVPRVISS